MTIIEQLRAALQNYQGPITGNSIEAVWFRETARQLLALEAATRVEGVR
jgi:hypothetical protein